MHDKIKNLSPLIGSAFFGIVAWFSAFIYVAQNDWFGVGDLSSFTFWIFIFSAIIYPILSVLNKNTLGKPSIYSYGLAILTSIITIILFIFLMLFVLGAWFGAYSFPVLFCLLIGVSFGTTLSVYIQRPKSWISAVFSVLFLPVIFQILVSIFLFQPDKLRITLSENANYEEINSLTDYITQIDGIRGFARVDGDGETRILIRFDTGLTDRKRNDIVSELKSISVIEKVMDIENK